MRGKLFNRLILLISFGLIIELISCSGSGKGRIRIYKDNPRYWEYNGKPVLLLGGSDEDNLFNNTPLMMKNLDILSRVGGNYIRSTLSWRDEGNVPPYLKSDGLYNLDNFNPEFFNRLGNCCQEAEARDIILQIEIWATFDYYRDNWLKNPFNPSNNINYTAKNTSLVTEWDYHPARNVQPFFYSMPKLNNDQVVLRYQEEFVKKVLDVTISYPNVLYCLDNETRAPAEWPIYWGEFIKKEAERRGYFVQLTEMWDPWDITDKQHRTTYEHPIYFSFTDVSQNNWQEEQTHYDRLIWYRENLAKQKGGVRPMNNVKVYARRGGGKPNDVQISIDRWWQNVFAGCASTRFHRPTGGIGLDNTAQKVIRAARVFTSSFNIFACEPKPELLSNREENEAYCLANPGNAYALYFPSGGDVKLEVENGDYRLRWLDTETASFMEPQTVSVRQYADLKSPNSGKTWLVLLDKK